MATKEQYPDPQQNQDFAPWLTVEHLGKSGKAELKLIGNIRPSNSQFGDGVIVDVKLGNSDYSWTVKFSSGNYARLVKMMGKPDKWKGKVSVEVKEYMGKEYVAVV